MPEPIVTVFDRALHDLAADCRIDREDATQLAEAAAASRHLQDPRPALVERMRTCAERIEPRAFAIMKQALAGEIDAGPDRVLLRPGARGPEVDRLRRSLGEVARLLGERRLDPGPGQLYDRRCREAVRAFQHRLQRTPADGLLDSVTLRVINVALRETDAPLLDVERQAARPAGVELHFYPGDSARKMVVRQGSRVPDVYDMRGGPAEERPDGRPGVDPRFAFRPSPAGRFAIGGSGAHVSASWKYSQIPWGARLRQRADGVVQFQAQAGGPWVDATGPDSPFGARGAHRRLTPDELKVGGRLPERYEQNDFGHRAFYLQREGQLQGHMIHATPPGERRYGDDTFELLESHGCEHLRPHELDEARSKGYLRPGTPFVVHTYDEPLPAAAVEWLNGREEGAGG